MLAVIAAGGGLGAPARYGLAQLVDVPAGGFPWATFWTNLTGSLVLGFVLALMIERFPPTRYVRPFVAVGSLGTYTTFSTFTFETVRLLEEGSTTEAFRNAVSSLVVGTAAAGIGLALAAL